MKTGLFFGSFNPIHIGHLIIGNHMVNYTDLQQVWYVVSPQNPLKHKSELLDEYQRLEMVHLATQDNPKLRACDIEFGLSKPSYTINTLLYLEEKYPGREWVLLMGSDTVQTLPKWKNYEQLVSNYSIYIYPRPGYNLQPNELTANMKQISDVPYMQISASYIRNAIKEKKDVRYLLEWRVQQYVDKWGLYL